MSFYLTTDGLLDQVSETEPRATFGKKSFCTIIQRCAAMPMEEQKDEIIKAHLDHRGAFPQLDDIAVLGFKIRMHE